MNIDDLMQQLTFTTRGTLEMCGWKPDRVVDTSDYFRAFTAKEMRAHDIAISFLALFGSLTIRVPKPRVPSRLMRVRFDPIEAVECDSHLQWWYGFQRATGVQLTVIGEYNNEQELLSIDRDGAIYANEEQGFFKLGDSVAMSLNAICEGRPIPEAVKYNSRSAYGS